MSHPTFQVLVPVPTLETLTVNQPSAKPLPLRQWSQETAQRSAGRREEGALPTQQCHPGTVQALLSAPDKTKTISLPTGNPKICAWKFCPPPARMLPGDPLRQRHSPFPVTPIPMFMSHCVLIRVNRSPQGASLRTLSHLSLDKAGRRTALDLWEAVHSPNSWLQC